MWHVDDLSGEGLPVLRVPAIDDPASRRFVATPERQTLAQDDQISGGPAGDESSHESNPLTTTFPATADSTQSGSDPNATSTPRFPGA